MRSQFVRAYPPAEPSVGPARWLVFRNTEVLVQPVDDRVELLMGGAELFATMNPGIPLYLGSLDDMSYIACEVAADAPLPEGWQALGLRALFGRISEEEYEIAGYASQMLFWQRTSRYCPVCGQPTEAVTGDWGRRCTSCGHTRYPQISPAILALVHDGDRILLTHKPGWGNMYSIIAGFVEPNEGLEACVYREVFEEVGVDLAEVMYGGSQPWPFPTQLMIGFMCRYSGGDIRIDDIELDDARWFHVDDLPQLPGALSLSRQLIDRWISSRRA